MLITIHKSLQTDLVSDGINCMPFCWLSLCIPPMDQLMSYGFHAVNDGFSWQTLQRRNAEDNFLWNYVECIYF